MTDQQCINLYETHLRDEKNASSNTIESYLRDLAQFANFLSENTSHNIASATPEDTQAYISHLRDMGKSVATVSRTIASIKNFYVQLCIKKIITHSPAIALKPDKAVHTVPNVMTNAEVQAMLKQPKCIDAKGYRDHAMLETIYATGLRVSEILELNVEDVLLDEGAILCHGKEKDRMVSLSDDAIKALTDYLELVRPQLVTNEDEKAVFVNVLGERLSRQGFWKIIKFYANAAGIQKNITPHTLRHSFAAHLLENGANAQDLQDIMGYSDVSSAHVYSQITKNNNVKEIYNKAHPRANA